MSLFLASFTCLFSLLCAMILAAMDKRAERILRRQAAGSGESIRLTDVKTFKISFWYLSAICVAYYICIFPFVSLGTVFFRRKYDFDTTEANLIDSIVYTISAVVCPIFGILIDMTGRNVIWVFAATVVPLASHAMLAFSFINPWVAMVLMGVGYSVLACALWPMVSLVIPEHQLGTAYGIMQSVQNLGLAVTPMIAGWLVDYKGYIVLEVFFLASMCVTVIFIVLLYVSDSNSGGHLNMSVKQRAKRDADIKALEERERERSVILNSPPAPVDANDLIQSQSQSENQIRNRYLSRVGAKDGEHNETTSNAPLYS
jgi:nitrate/nitrite transporter NarK